jgi:hypothetical protein
VLDGPDAAAGGITIANPVWNPWRSIRAVALAGLGRIPEAVETAEEEVALLRRWGAPSFLGRALCLLGELLGPAGLDDLRESVGLLAATSAAVDLARAQCALGCRPDVADQEAVPMLEAANSLAEQRGATGIRASALAELERRGHRVELRDDQVAAPSRTEQRILDLAATGLEAHKIAQRLFVTPGTVRAVLDEAGPGTAGGSGISQVGQGSMVYGEDRRLP